MPKPANQQPADRRRGSGRPQSRGQAPVVSAAISLETLIAIDEVADHRDMSRSSVIREILDSGVGDLIVRQRAEQGLPKHVEDPAILADVAAIVRADERSRSLMASEPAAMTQ